MKVEKIRRKGFTVISNDVLNNTALSWKAKGIFAYLWSQSDSWNFYEVEVLKHSTDGKASLKAGLKEIQALLICWIFKALSCARRKRLFERKQMDFVRRTYVRLSNVG